MQDYNNYEPYHKFAYDGPVLEFDRLVANHWTGETMTPTARKAMSNLSYQYKKQNNRNARTKVTLPGEIKMVN